MGTKPIRIALVAMLATTALVAATSAAAKTVPLSGTQTTINEKKGIYKMHGSLRGRWYGLSFVPQAKSPSQLVAIGRERFVGCLDSNRNTVCDAAEPAGTINFTYTAWFSFNPSTKAFVRGQCLHPVTGGTGAFAEARGVVTMVDTPVGKTIQTTYKGLLTYGPTAADRIPTSARPGDEAEARSTC